MSAAARTTEALPQETPMELVDLKRAIDALPPNFRQSILPSLQRVMETTTRRRKILQLVQEALGQLRLDMKYLVFDLEATRRERDQYQNQVRRMTGEDQTFGE